MLGAPVTQLQANKFYYHLHEIEIKYCLCWTYRLKHILSDILDGDLVTLWMKKPVEEANSHLSRTVTQATVWQFLHKHRQMLIPIVLKMPKETIWGWRDDSEDQVQIPSTHCLAWQSTPVIPELWGWDRQVLEGQWAHYPASLAKLKSFRFSHRPSLKK